MFIGTIFASAFVFEVYGTGIEIGGVVLLIRIYRVYDRTTQSIFDSINRGVS